jgi:hypothetical protein
MKKYKKVLKSELSDVVCDICGASCLDPRYPDVAMAEFATLETNWGYLSKKDGERANWEMCEACFDKVKSYMDSLKAAQ